MEPFVFTGDLNILKALEMGPPVQEAFKRLRLHCLDKFGELCVAAEVETLADAARFHEIPLETILAELNRLGVQPK